MRTVRITEDVWNAIAARGKFGETEDDVLRRILGIESNKEGRRLNGKIRPGRGNTRYAVKRMSARVEAGQLVVEFSDGARHQWRLPDPSDKYVIRDIRNAAVAFALENGASDPGQTNTVRKALTDAGFHLTK